MLLIVTVVVAAAAAVTVTQSLNQNVEHVGKLRVLENVGASGNKRIKVAQRVANNWKYTFYSRFLLYEQ